MSVQYLSLLLGLAAASLGPFEVLYAWDRIDFQYPSENAREAAIASGDLIQKHVLPVGIEIWQDKLFVTLSRRRKGVPANLNYISLSNTTGNKSPALIPYPDWETNDIRQNGTEPIVHIYRVSVDACDRLWAIDTGLHDGKRITPVQLIVIDLKTDKIIRRYKLLESDQKCESYFANVVVDVEAGACDEAFGYFPDSGANGLIVYSWEQNKSWRVSHNYFNSDPLQGDFNISGINFQWPDGIFGTTLGPLLSDGYKNLYFHALASTTEFVVSTKILRNETSATSSDNYYDFKRLGSKGDFMECTTAVMDFQSGVAFFAAVNKDGIACWDSKKPLEESNYRLVAQDHEALVWANDVKIDRDQRLLYAVSDKLPILEYAEMDPGEGINYRILRASVDEAAKTCL